MGHKIYLLYVEDQNGDIQALVPLTHVKSLLFGNALHSVGFATFGGALSNTANALEMLDKQAIDLMHDVGASFIEYRSTKAAHPGTSWASKTEMYSVFRKEISADHEENMLAIPRKQRAMVRKGLKAGLSYEIEDNVDRIHSIYAESVRNLGTPVFPKKFFRELQKHYAENCEVLTVVTDQGEALTSVMSFYFRDEILPYFGGGSIAARKYAANDFMYWSVMERAVNERGTKIFDFGRSKNGTGSFNFKKHWGFEPQPLHYEYYLKDGGEIPEINPMNPKYRLMINTWKKLPLSVANFIGPRVSRSLG